MTEPLTLAQRLRDHRQAFGVHHEPREVELCIEAAAELDRLIDANKALTAERDEAVNDTLAAEAELSLVRKGRDSLSAELAEARKIIKPFSDIAGEMFSRGWDASNVALALDNPDDPHRVTAGDFFTARSFLASKEASQ